MDTSETTTATYYWLAINGPSCAACPIPLPTTLQVSPTPQWLLGYASRDEQMKALKFFLTAPIKTVAKHMREQLLKDVAKGKVVSIMPPNPEPPTRGQMYWMS